MGEEAGSPGLADTFRIHKNRLVADALIASDGPRQQPDRPTVFVGSRGAVNFELSLDLREGAHPSGERGGPLADPAQILARAIASIATPQGAPAIPEWRPSSLTPEIRETPAARPIDEPTGPAIDHDRG